MSVVLQPPLLHLRSDLREEIGDRFDAKIAFLAVADGDGLLGGRESVCAH